MRRASRLRAELEMAVAVPPALPPLSAAVEVAAYCIVQEALSNVVRHARARRCEVRLLLDEEPCVTISDDGRGLAPDVVLMDIQMEDNGISATGRILDFDPEVRVLMLTMFDDDSSVFAAMLAGARGYILKGARRDEVLRAIRAVADGEAIFSPAFAARMVDFFAVVRPAQLPDAFPDLTEREREVLNLLARDYRNAQIAEELVISPKTVGNYVSTILGKLQAADQPDAAARARDAGFG